MLSKKPNWAETTITDFPDWLGRIRREGREDWNNASWPTRKTEDWKYTPLRSLEQFAPVADPNSSAGQGTITPEQQIEQLDAYRLVFFNGRYNSALSDINGLPGGVELVRFAEASQSQVHKIQRYLNSAVDTQEHLFAALNNATLVDGVFLCVSAGVQLDKPVIIVHATHGEDAEQFSPRLLCVVEKSARAELIEQFINDNDTCGHFSCGITELFVEENASFEHCRLHLEQGEHRQIGGVHVVLHRNARLTGFHLALGSLLQRIDLVVHHRGEGAQCVLNGVYLPVQQQLVDYHTCIEHAVPHCTTHEVFRGIIGGKAKAVFNGRIHIHPHAQKTLAQLSNRNLLTSDKAEVDTKPELEIYADDVQCAHGATVAQIDQVAMHYFRTRGVSEKEAEVMLSFGFINELLNEVSLQAVADYLRPLLAERFARDPKLLRHIA